MAPSTARSSSVARVGSGVIHLVSPAKAGAYRAIGPGIVIGLRRLARWADGPQSLRPGNDDRRRMSGPVSRTYSEPDGRALPEHTCPQPKDKTSPGSCHIRRGRRVILLQVSAEANGAQCRLAENQGYSSSFSEQSLMHSPGETQRHDTNRIIRVHSSYRLRVPPPD
jgi:hypothetical protein